jgi:hypothetical protein
MREWLTSKRIVQSDKEAHRLRREHANWPQEVLVQEALQRVLLHLLARVQGPPARLQAELPRLACEEHRCKCLRPEDHIE